MHENYERSIAASLVDPLTGAFNRRYLEAHMPTPIPKATMPRRPSYDSIFGA
jgi:PleD family two-component response regulator